MKEKVIKWLSENFNIPVSCWHVIDTNTYHYSQSYIFSQSRYTSAPHKVFVKCICSGNESDSKIHYFTEKNVLKIASLSQTEYVRAPIIYSASDSMRCVSLEFVEGISCFNKIWNTRRKCMFLTGISCNNKIILSELAKWLALFHRSIHGDSFRKNNIVERSIDEHFVEIEKRVNFLLGNKVCVLGKNIFKQACLVAKHISERVKSSDLANNYVLCHGDFTLVNIICHDDMTYVVDYSMAALSFKEDDLARFITDIWNITISVKRITSCNDIFRSDATRLVLDSYGYAESDMDIIKFFMIKHALINITMYVIYIRKNRLMGAMYYIFLINQVRLLKSLL